MREEIKLLKNNDCYKKGQTIKPIGFMIHSTGAPNPNIDRYVDIPNGRFSNHWNKPGITKCVHGFVGKFPNGEIGFCQTLPFTMRGWHAGGGKKGSYNNTHIGVEICEDLLNDRNYLITCLEIIIKEIADLTEIFKWDLNDPITIVSHHEGHLQGYASNHADIDHWLTKFNLNMNWVRQKIKEELERRNKPVNTEDVPTPGWGKAARDWAVASGITDGTFPHSYCTREQVWAMLQRFEERMKKNDK